jgi:hypothetical protein
MSRVAGVRYGTAAYGTNFQGFLISPATAGIVFGSVCTQHLSENAMETKLIDGVARVPKAGK